MLFPPSFLSLSQAILCDELRVFGSLRELDG